MAGLRVHRLAREPTISRFFPRVVKAIKKKGINDVLVVGGGVIPDIDHKDLIKSGVKHVFGPGTPLPTIIDNITAGVSKLRKI